MMIMGLAPIEYFESYGQAKERLPELRKEWDGIELVILKEREGHYSISGD